MSYYGAGDYYGAGGIFGSILGGIGGAVTGLLSGGPIGAVTGAISGFSKGTTPGTGIVATPPSIPVLKTPGITGTIQRLVPGGATGYQIPMTGLGGYHVNKEGYWTKGGYVPAGSKLVKNRRMNPGNARALRRSIRREKAFVGLAKRVLRGTGLTVKRTAGIASRRRKR